MQQWRVPDIAVSSLRTLLEPNTGPDVGQGEVEPLQGKSKVERVWRNARSVNNYWNSALGPVPFRARKNGVWVASARARASAPPHSEPESARPHPEQIEHVPSWARHGLGPSARLCD